MITLIVFWLMYPACSMHYKRHIYSALRMRYLQTRITVQIIYALKKTIYGLKKTIYGLKRLFTALT